MRKICPSTEGDQAAVRRWAESASFQRVSPRWAVRRPRVSTLLRHNYGTLRAGADYQDLGGTRSRVDSRQRAKLVGFASRGDQVAQHRQRVEFWRFSRIRSHTETIVSSGRISFLSAIEKALAVFRHWGRPTHAGVDGTRRTLSRIPHSYFGQRRSSALSSGRVLSSPTVRHVLRRLNCF